MNTASVEKSLERIKEFDWNKTAEKTIEVYKEIQS